MSQKKVDQYKKEKKNRAKKLRQHRARQYAMIMIGCAALGGAVGYPFGRFLYRHHYNQRKASATVEAAQFDYWYGKYWDANVSDKLGYRVLVPDDTASVTDASVTDAE